MTIVTALILLNYVIIATAALGLWSRIVRIERAVSNEARLTRAEFEPLPARLRALDHSPSPPPSFVSLLLLGEDPNGAPILAGACELLTGKPGESRELEVSPQIPIKRAYAIVLCDTSRVGVQVFKGVDLMAATVGDCPLARIGDVDLGISVRAIAFLRVP